MNQSDNPSISELKSEIRLKAKNGIDFILASGTIWILLFVIWKFTKNSSYDKSVFSFMASGVLIPVALLFSKLLKTTWKIPGNPLQPLGLWLNFAQLFYFPFLFFILVKYPDYFIMTYAIITGAHLFPYAWFYNEVGYAVAAFVISVGALVIGLCVMPQQMFFIPAFTAICMFLLAVRIGLSFNKKSGL